MDFFFSNAGAYITRCLCYKEGIEIFCFLLSEKETCDTKSQTRQSRVDPAPSTIPYQPGMNGAARLAPQEVDKFHNMAPRNSVSLLAFFCMFGHFLNSLLMMPR